MMRAIINGLLAGLIVFGLLAILIAWVGFWFNWAVGGGNAAIALSMGFGAPVALAVFLVVIGAELNL